MNWRKWGNLFLGLGFIVAVSVTTTPPVKAASVDHYLGHKVNTAKGTPKFEKRVVTLTDQFETGSFEVKKPRKIFNPASKNDEGISDPNTHLVGYKIKLVKGEPEHVKQTNIKVTNQFGTIFVDTEKPDLLLVPSSKSLTDPDVLAPVNSSHNVDHFKCYGVEVTDGTREFPEGIQVRVEDQFTFSSLFDVEEPTRFCNPVDKDGEGIKNPGVHLMCYEIKKSGSGGIYVNNQFGALEFEMKKGGSDKELCVPSTQTLPSDPPPCTPPDC